MHNILIVYDCNFVVPIWPQQKTGSKKSWTDSPTSHKACESDVYVPGH